VGRRLTPGSDEREWCWLPVTAPKRRHRQPPTAWTQRGAVGVFAGAFPDSTVSVRSADARVTLAYWGAAGVTVKG
jgi:hypothetical protein